MSDLEDRLAGGVNTDENGRFENRCPGVAGMSETRTPPDSEEGKKSPEGRQREGVAGYHYWRWRRLGSSETLAGYSWAWRRLAAAFWRFAEKRVQGKREGVAEGLEGVEGEGCKTRSSLNKCWAFRRRGG